MGIRKTFSGLMKLIYSDKNCTKGEKIEVETSENMNMPKRKPIPVINKRSGYSIVPGVIFTSG